jgi:hypothetical protein
MAPTYLNSNQTRVSLVNLGPQNPCLGLVEQGKYMEYYFIQDSLECK